MVMPLSAQSVVAASLLAMTIGPLGVVGARVAERLAQARATTHHVSGMVAHPQGSGGSTESLSVPPLPAPMSDYWVPAGWSYHNVATLGPSPKAVTTAVTTSLTELEVSKSQRDTHQARRHERKHHPHKRDASINSCADVDQQQSPSCHMFVDPSPTRT